MVRIRMRRVGGKKQPSYRIVAADKESPRDGRFIEILGFYNPRTEPATIQLKEDRIYDWMSKGAQPSDSALQVFRVAGLIERFERFKAGENLEKLVAEAEQAASARNTGTKTRRPAPENAPNNKKKAAAKAVEAQAAEAAESAEAAEDEASAEEPVAADEQPSEADPETPAEDVEEEAQPEAKADEPEAEVAEEPKAEVDASAEEVVEEESEEPAAEAEEAAEEDTKD